MRCDQGSGSSMEDTLLYLLQTTDRSACMELQERQAGRQTFLFLLVQSFPQAGLQMPEDLLSTLASRSGERDSS